MSKNSKVADFIKRNAYYLAFVLCLAVLAVITIALVMTGSKDNSLQTGGGNQVEQDQNQNDQNQNDQTQNDQNQNDQNQNDQVQGGGNQDDEGDNENEPTVSVIIFDMPVSGGSIIKDYVGASVVYNQTLVLYSGHKAVDFGAEEGAEVYCAYDGTVESIEISKVNGTSITVDHGNGLKTVYNSIESVDNLEQGITLKKGDVIGYVSTNNKTEYLDGAHLHFEVWEEGVKVDPNKYLISEDK